MIDHGEDEISEGLSALESAILEETGPTPVIEDIDLLVFRKPNLMAIAK